MTADSETIPDISGHIKYVNVLLPLPLAKTYTYSYSSSSLSEQSLELGDFVLVPFGSRQVVGVVWEGSIVNIGSYKIKNILSKLEFPRMLETTRRFVEWVARYNMSSIGSVLKLFMSVPDALKPGKKNLIFYQLANGLSDLRMTKSRKRVIGVLREHKALTGSDLAKKADVSRSVITSLANIGSLKSKEVPAPNMFETPDINLPAPHLTEEQSVVALKLAGDVRERRSDINVLEGVPGSGKTEVYLAAISEAIAIGKQALVLLPEISLSTQWLSRFEKRFGCLPAEWHSDLSQANRRKIWQAVAAGDARVIVGARSALFLPYKCLGVIVVDEEHDQSFKQEEGVIYNARDMAIVRANLGGIPITLVSATPSLESLHNVAKNKYKHFNLPARFGGASLPEMNIVDLREDRPSSGKWISSELFNAMKKTFAAGEQALLFLNRRGYAPLTLCRECGYRFECKNCTAWLVEHRFIGQLQCHHCGFQIKTPKVCPNCDQEETFFACGPGVERLAEECHELFPEIRTVVAVSDNLQTPSQAAELIKKIEAREIDLIIGTQIVAKGYHFPYLTLVGAVDADIGLSGGDIRALERTYQLLYQVSGRSGREELPGRVFIQTYDPDNTVIRAISQNDHKTFIRGLIADRERNQMPPFGRLAGVILSCSDEQLVEKAARDLARSAPKKKGIITLGPALAPLAVLRGLHRRRFLVKSTAGKNLQSYLRNWVRLTKTPKKVRIQFDIDPYSFM